METFSDLLAKGGPRSGGDAGAVLNVLSKSLDRLPELIECLRNPDPVARARASAVLERVTRSQPDAAQDARRELLELASSQEFWLTRMNICRMCTLVQWSEPEYEWILAFLFSEAARNEGFVSAWALNALARLSEEDESIRSRVRFLLDEAMATGSAAVAARARSALAGLDRKLLSGT